MACHDRRRTRKRTGLTALGALTMPGRRPGFVAILALAALAAGPVAAAESVEACLASKVPINQLNCLSRLA